MFVYDQAGEHPCGALLLLYGIEGCGGCVPLSSWLEHGVLHAILAGLSKV